MKKVLLVAVSVLLVCTSCVTKKKYLLAENGRLEAIARGDDLQNQLVNCRDNNDGLTSRLASLERDTTRMGKNIRNYQSMLNTNMTEQTNFFSNREAPVSTSVARRLWPNSPKSLTNNPTSTFISKGTPIASRSTPPSLKTTGISVSSAPLRSSAS